MASGALEGASVCNSDYQSLQKIESPWPTLYLGGHDFLQKHSRETEYTFLSRSLQGLPS